MSDKQSELINIDQLSEWLGICRGTLRNYTAYRKIPFVKISGRHVRYRRSDIEKWLAERTQEVRE